MRLAALLLAATALLSAQERNPVRWKLAVGPGIVPPGGKTTATLTAVIEPGWHLYSPRKLEGGPIPTTIAVPPGQVFRQDGEITMPPPLARQDDAFGMEVEYFEGEVEFAVPLQAAGDAPPGKTAVVLTARYQVCDDKICLPPRTVKVEASAIIQAGR